MTRGGISERSYIVIPKLVEESCDDTSLNFLHSFTLLYCRCLWQRFLHFGRNDKEQNTQPSSVSFAVLRGGKSNRHYGHSSRGTYALTHLTPPKQRTVLFGKCGVRPSPFIMGEGKGGVLLCSLTDGVLRLGYASLRMTIEKLSG
jgi:hypothetical protein